MVATRTRRVRPVSPSKKSVSPAERQLLQRIKEEAAGFDNRMFAEMYVEAVRRVVEDGDNSLFSFLSHLEEIPVSIEEFLDSRRFFGAVDMNIWPEVRSAIIGINKDWWKGEASAIHEADLMGATGTGKTSIAQVTTAYHTYLLGCLRIPQAVYGLPKATSIVFPIMAAKPHVTRKVVYQPLRKMLEEIPWFQERMVMDKLIESEIVFPEKNVRISLGGADSDSILGEAVIGGIIDEINFMNVVLKSKKAEVTSGRAGIYDQAQTIYDAMTRRKKSRFISRGPTIGVIVVSSSIRYRGDFTDRRKAHVQKHKEAGVYIYDKKQYEVWPQDRYCGLTFRLLVGNDFLTDTRILRSDENVPNGSLVLDVPVEYESDFRKDPHGALRDVVGMASDAIAPFFRRRFKIHECFMAGKEAGLESFLEKDNVVLGIDGMPMVKKGHYCKDPSRPRYVHIDLSSTGDRCVAKGQPVLMADGRYVPIERVRVGDRVVTHEGGYEEVTRVFDNGIKPTIAVGVYGWNEELKVTATHKVWAVKRSAVAYADGRLVKPSDRMFSGRSAKAAKKRYSYVPEFVELGSLRPGDFLATPRRARQAASNICGVPLTYETGYLAGLFAAEGSFYLNHGTEYVQFSLHTDETAIRKNLERYLRKYFGVGIRVCRDKKSKGVTVRTQKSDALVSFMLTAVGEYSYRKHLDCAHIGSAMFHAGVAHGYVDGDGCVKYASDGTASSFKVKTVSRQMAFSFYWLLISNGFTPVIGQIEAYTDSANVPHRTCYYVSLSGRESMRSFASWDATAIDVPCSQSMALPDYVLSPIMYMEDGGETAVYDLSVGETHSYVVGNTAVHNCGIAMVRFDGLQNVVREGNLTERLPSCSVELACSIEPDSQNEIDLAEVRMWVKHLRDLFGYPIKVVTYDGFESRESIQQWKKQNVKTGRVSVDRTSTPYKQLRDAINDGRVHFYENDILLNEFFELEYDEKADKVDHPVDGSKDVADAVCGAYTTMITRRASWMITAGDDQEAQESLRKEYEQRYDNERPH